LVFPENVILLETRSPERVMERVTYWRVRRGLSSVCVVNYPPIRSIAPSFFDEVEKRLSSGARVNIKEKLTYKKFTSDILTVLLLDYPYFLTKDLKKALVRMGHRVVSVPCSKEDSTGDVIQRVAKAVIEFRPDFLFSVNHLGFDEGGELTRFLESIELPAAVWYVDSPDVIISPYAGNCSDIVALFVWDWAYVDSLRKKGYSRVEFLPLATDEACFKPVIVSHRVRRKFAADVGFVGSSLVVSFEEAFTKLSPESSSYVEVCAKSLFELFIRGEGKLFQQVLDKFPVEVRSFYDSLCRVERAYFEAAVLWKATHLYRLFYLKKLESFRPVIHGDAHWRKVLNGPFRIKRLLRYYDELPLFYRCCLVNINITSLQMPTGVNQRVFDVPACGGFLLTDYRESLRELFRVGEEVVVYRSPDEIEDLVRYYLSHEAERRKVVQRARERVLGEHTYKARVEKIVKTMREMSRGMLTGGVPRMRKGPVDLEDNC